MRRRALYVHQRSATVIPPARQIDTMKRMTLRLSEALHTALKERSVQENRSLHGEILHLLKQTVGSVTASQLQEEHDAE
jgi:predicted HicB family RNase H-like nuclease